MYIKFYLFYRIRRGPFASLDVMIKDGGNVIDLEMFLRDKQLDFIYGIRELLETIGP